MFLRNPEITLDRVVGWVHTKHMTTTCRLRTLLDAFLAWNDGERIDNACLAVDDFEASTGTEMTDNEYHALVQELADPSI